MPRAWSARDASDTLSTMISRRSTLGVVASVVALSLAGCSAPDAGPVTLEEAEAAAARVLALAPQEFTPDALDAFCDELTHSPHRCDAWVDDWLPAGSPPLLESVQVEAQPFTETTTKVVFRGELLDGTPFESESQVLRLDSDEPELLYPVFWVPRVMESSELPEAPAP